MATEVVMPQMGESIAEGTITKWLVKVGEEVERDQPLFEISTDKVDAEIPSPASGVLTEIKQGEGETVPVNEVVALIGEAGEEPAAAAKDEEPEAEEKTEEAAPAAAEKADAAEKDEKDGEDEKEATAKAAAAEDEDDEKDEEPEAEAKAEKAEKAEPEEGNGELAERVRTRSSPVVRKMAAEKGVDISEIEGSGVHGRVTKRDLEDHLARAEEAPAKAPTVGPAAGPGPLPASASPSGASPMPDFSVPAYSEGEEVEIEPMSRIRQITAAHMRYSKDVSAHVTTVFHIDMSGVALARNRAKRGFAAANGTKLTYMPFIFKAVAGGLKRHKQLNAAVDGTNVVYKKRINLGMAVAMDKGLLVPVIKDADQLSLVGLAKTANDLAERARSKKLGPDELKGGTFTITNPGVFGTLFGTPIINQPQVAILGLGVIEKRPVIETDARGNDLIAIKTMSYFAITYDHRLIDGADADHFMNDVKKTLEGETWSELDAYS